MLLESDINEYDDNYIDLCSLSSFFLLNLNLKKWKKEMKLSTLKNKCYKVESLKIDDYNVLENVNFVRKFNTHNISLIYPYKNINHLILNDLFFNNINMNEFPNIKKLEVQTEGISIILSNSIEFLYTYSKENLNIDLTNSTNLKQLSSFSNININGIENCNNLEIISCINSLNINYNYFKKLEEITIFFLFNDNLNISECLNLRVLSVCGMFNSELDLSKNKKLYKFNSIPSSLNSIVKFPNSIESISLDRNYSKELNFKNLKNLKSLTLLRYKYKIILNENIEYLYINSESLGINLRKCNKIKILSCHNIKTIIFPENNIIEKLDLTYSNMIDFEKFKKLKYLTLKSYNHQIKLQGLNLISINIKSNLKCKLYLLSSYDLIELELKSYNFELNFKNNIYLEKLIILENFSKDLNLKNLNQLKEIVVPKNYKGKIIR